MGGPTATWCGAPRRLNRRRRHAVNAPVALKAALLERPANTRSWWGSRRFQHPLRGVLGENVGDS